MSVQISVSDVNDNPPGFSQSFYTTTVPEYLPTGASAFQVHRVWSEYNKLSSLDQTQSFLMIFPALACLHLHQLPIALCGMWILYIKALIQQVYCIYYRGGHSSDMYACSCMCTHVHINAHVHITNCQTIYLHPPHTSTPHTGGGCRP